VPQAPGTSRSPTTPTWGAVVPVKRLDVAKSRLAAYGDPVRAELALAFACDVVTACLSCVSVSTVVVVTDDGRAAAVLRELGAQVVPDGPDRGLNPALAHGARVVRAALPAVGVVAVSADLASLRSEDLAAMLVGVPRGQRAFVADSDRLGTTLLAACAGVALLPSFGLHSRARHLASGAIELEAGEALRRDVDTPDDLGQALLLGVGRHTAQALARLA